ncbi:hypothetical protein C8F01DRAFT_1329289 [Mycena amicta]|nr:hypothetical protein C8F01DRAFT_1329289 [Mycena amicta]
MVESYLRSARATETELHVTTGGIHLKSALFTRADTRTCRCSVTIQPKKTPDYSDSKTSDFPNLLRGIGELRPPKPTIPKPTAQRKTKTSEKARESLVGPLKKHTISRSRIPVASGSRIPNLSIGPEESASSRVQRVREDSESEPDLVDEEIVDFLIQQGELLQQPNQMVQPIPGGAGQAGPAAGAGGAGVAAGAGAAQGAAGQAGVQPQGQPAGNARNDAAAKFRIPEGYDVHRPRFDGQHPEKNLKSFIRRCKGIFENGKVEEDNEKKRLVMEYLDNDAVYDQWESLESYVGGTFTEWEKAIIALYPELEDVEKGTMKRLLNVMREYDGTRRSDLGPLRRLGYSFIREADKLLIEPAVITNRELVSHYLGALDASFEAAVRSAMDGPDLTRIIGDPAPGRTMRRGDRLTYKEVIKVAEYLADQYSGVDSNSRSPPAGNRREESREVQPRFKREVDDRLNQFSAEIAGVKDMITVQGNKMEQTLSKWETSLENSMRVMKQELQPRQREVGPSGEFQSGAMMGCHFCGGSHVIAKCTVKDQYILLGYIIVEDRFLKLPGGMDIPFFPGAKTRKDRVDEFYKRQGVDTSLGKPKSQMYSSQIEQDAIYGDMIGQFYESSADEILSANVQRSPQSKDG